MSTAAECLYLIALSRVERKRNLQAIRGKKWRDSHREELRMMDLEAYYRNRPKHLVAMAERRSKTPGGWQKYQKEWRSKHPEKQKEYTARYRSKPDTKAKVNRAYRIRYHRDVNFRLGKLLRARVLDAIKRHRTTKHASTSAMIGCSVEFLIGHIQARFKPGMSWDNYGKVWQIDHIIPCDFFDLSQPNQQKACFSYQNLQPLFSVENFRKWANLVPSNMNLTAILQFALAMLPLVETGVVQFLDWIGVLKAALVQAGEWTPELDASYRAALFAKTGDPAYKPDPTPPAA